MKTHIQGLKWQSKPEKCFTPDISHLLPPSVWRFEVENTEPFSLRFLAGNSLEMANRVCTTFPECFLNIYPIFREVNKNGKFTPRQGTSGLTHFLGK
ncbi:MAG TPA: hypothetical protein GXX65_02075 [Methanosarcina sp.]|nr:hypothetical protein [Methanosarcina sp.]